MRRLASRGIWICGLAWALLLLSGLFAAPVQAALVDVETFESHFTSQDYGHILVINRESLPVGPVSSNEYELRLHHNQAFEQEFTTGSHALGYRFYLLYFLVRAIPNANFTTNLYRGNSLLVNLDNSGVSIDPEEYDSHYFGVWSRALGGQQLQPDTTYRFRVTNNSRDEHQVVLTTNHGQVGSRGWSIADNSTFISDGTTSSHDPITMHLWGVPILGPPRNVQAHVDLDDSNNINVTWDHVLHVHTAEVERYQVDTCENGLWVRCQLDPNTYSFDRGCGNV